MIRLTPPPRVYAACLASYNSGKLHGEWIDADMGEAYLSSEIGKMLDASPEPNAEEWAIHDYENMPNLGEYPNIETLALVGEGIEEHGDAFIAYAELFESCGELSLDDFYNRYCGEFDDWADFAESDLESLGALNEISEHLRMYFDFEAYGRDMRVNGYYTETNGFFFRTEV